jgi:predicted NAD-dependent protein-ADP-ribosyltransferase YbiA (DUF1768 family)
MVPIYFYRKGLYYEFSNYFKCKVVINEIEYLSVEHYFQSEKFNYEGSSDLTREYYELLLECDSPQKSKDMGGQKCNNRFKTWKINKDKPGLGLVNDAIIKFKDARIDPNWEERKIDVMLDGLRSKFTLNTKLRKILLDTENNELFEDSPYDMFWGCKGKNALGICLETVRDELRHG